MATLIPALGTCVSRMTTGERRLGERLEQKLDDDYLAWYDVPIGPKQSHPDFVVLHPRRGLLILEVKDWRLDTLRQVDPEVWEIAPDGVPKNVPNPFVQARHYAHEVVNALERDARLVEPEGSYKGKLCFPWSYGVVLTRITRKQFEAAGLGSAIEPHRVLCSDEMTESVETEDFQSRLWGMFPHMMRGVLSLPQIDRVRWILFPQVRVSSQVSLFAAEGAADDDDDGEDQRLPDIMRVMDLQQEQLARSLGDGHRVIHGVAGSGKTMILGYRAEQLAQAATQEKPVLVLCFNEPLAVKIAGQMQAKGLADRVQAIHFHKWCRQQLVAYGQPLPPQGDRELFFAQMVNRVIHGVERRQIPSGQYLAILIDEGHDFQPAWFKLVTQMVDPSTNSLLVLYDDAQSIYERQHRRGFSFKSVGIQAQGRTTILKINYRNTRQILQTAHSVAADLLKPDECDDDGIPLLQPISCGRDGPAPLIVRLPTLREEAFHIADWLSTAHREGRAWGDMAILCRNRTVMDACATALRQRKLPHQVRQGAGSFNPLADTIKVMSMHASKGLEFLVVALAGVGQMPAADADEAEEAKLFYVAATRAQERLCVTLSGTGKFGERVGV